MSVSVLQVWAEGVDDEGVKEADEEDEEEVGVMGEGPAPTTTEKDVEARGSIFLSICGLVPSPSPSTCWWWSSPPRSRHLVTRNTQLYFAAPASSVAVGNALCECPLARARRL